MVACPFDVVVLRLLVALIHLLSVGLLRGFAFWRSLTLHR